MNKNEQNEQNEQKPPEEALDLPQEVFVRFCITPESVKLVGTLPPLRGPPSLSGRAREL